MAGLVHLASAASDPRLAILSAVVCYGACLTAFLLHERAKGALGVVRGAWLLLTGLVAGTGIWASLFLAMLGLHPPMAVGFQPLAALVALSLSTALIGGGFALAASHDQRHHRLGGGALAGLGLIALYFAGLASYQVAGQIELNPVFLGAGLGAAIAGAMLSLNLRLGEGLKDKLIGAGVLAAGACGLQLLGLGALHAQPDPSIHLGSDLLSGAALGFPVVGMTILIVLGGLGAVLIESQTRGAATERLRRLADAAHEGLVVVQNGAINDANSAFCGLVGASLEDLKGRRLVGNMLFFDDEDEGLADGRREGAIQPNDGSREIPVEILTRRLDAADRAETAGMAVLAIRDLSERRSADEKIRYLAEHDALTGLPNRNALQARLNETVERARASGQSLAVICVDLDHFKEANDLHGQAGGDALLMEAAARLASRVSAPSFAARLGADEFILVQVGAGEQPTAAGELASLIVEAFAEPCYFEDKELTLSATLGISLYPEDGMTGEALLANADLALFRAKENARGAYRFFSREMDDSLRERRSLARDLKEGIERDELVVHYQPLALADSGEIASFEALVRWKHPTRGLIPPFAFIEIAEEYNLIGALGEWVLRKACAEAASWEKPLGVAVNLSPLQLGSPGLSTLVHEVLIETGLSPKRLELEVTESALFADPQGALDNLRRLKALGAKIAMDDFGTGFSSLSTLQSFPFDKLKIDKSFVDQIFTDDRGTAIVRAVLGLGKSLGIPVTAEGVETADQCDFLREEGASTLQGYFIGRPTPAEGLDQWTRTAPDGIAQTKPKRVKRAA